MSEQAQQYLPPPEFVIDTLRQQLVNVQDKVNMLEIQNGFLNTVISGLSHQLEHAAGIEHDVHEGDAGPDISESLAADPDAQ